MSILTLKKPGTFHSWMQIYRLYRSSFPAAERKPFSVIRQLQRKGIADVWCLEYQGSFAGFAVTVRSDRLVLIDYLAVSAARRGLGIGTLALQALRRQYDNQGIFLEIESVTESCGNQAQRLMRRAFYLRCGFVPMGFMVSLFGVKMEVLGLDCHFDYETYAGFYRQQLGSWVAGHIRPAE